MVQKSRRRVARPVNPSDTYSGRCAPSAMRHILPVRAFAAADFPLLAALAPQDQRPDAVADKQPGAGQLKMPLVAAEQAVVE